MYMKGLLGLFYVLHILSNGLALPVSGQANNGAPLSTDNIDQTMKDAVQTLLAGLLMKGNDLRAELQEEARALLDDPYPFDDTTLAEVAQLAAQEVKEAARGPEPDAPTEEDVPEVGVADSDTPLAREAPESGDTKSVRSLADDTLQELNRLYARSEIPATAAETHHKFSDFFHLPSLSSLLGDYPMEPYPMDPSLQPVPTVPDTPLVDPIPDVSVPNPVVDAVTPPPPPPPPPVDVAAPVDAPVDPPLPEARSVDNEPSATEQN